MGMPRHWRESKYRYVLTGTLCPNCQKMHSPPRSICPDCHRKSIEGIKEIRMSGKGTVLSFSVIHDPPVHMLQTPYILGLIELEEGPRVTAQIVDVTPDRIHLGTRVKACFRRLFQEGASGIIGYGYKFIIDEEFLEQAEAEETNQGDAPPAPVAEPEPFDPVADEGRVPPRPSSN